VDKYFCFPSTHPSGQFVSIDSLSFIRVAWLPPHGIDFLSDDTIVVANRSGWGTFYRLPAAWGDRMTLDPDHEMDSVWFGRKGTTRDIHGRAVVCGPGAVRVSG
jgi:hypothetical protein